MAIDLARHQDADCVVVGGGPAGVLLAYLLARHGVEVILLEAHADFDRKFRGDTLHPSSLEILDQLGLADTLLEKPHGRLYEVTIQTPNGGFTLAEFSKLRSKYPFVALVPQVDFLNFLVQRAADLPSFRIVMGAQVRRLIEESGRVVGVSYESHDGWHEVRAHLTIGADGRHSTLRKLIGAESLKTSPPMDVLWMELFRLPNDESLPSFRAGGGHLLVVFDRGDRWQLVVWVRSSCHIRDGSWALARRDDDSYLEILGGGATQSRGREAPEDGTNFWPRPLGLVILKGTLRDVKREGIDGVHRILCDLLPELSSRIVSEISDWIPLNVESSRVRRWYRDGILLIGDAAHVMSPVGGVGINYAIQDAVEAANLLHKPLANHTVTISDLKRIQRSRELPVRVVQLFQRFLQHRFVKTALDPHKAFQPPRLLRLPWIRRLPARMLAYGLKRIRVEGIDDSMSRECTTEGKQSRRPLPP